MHNIGSTGWQEGFGVKLVFLQLFVWRDRLGEGSL